ncbi:MAG: 5'/3'-nucleotidase SurE [Candidatus Micrarchaeia archaeon]
MILVTNDDGIFSRGIMTLYKSAVEVFGRRNVLVVAPSGPQSASGMSLTFHKPLRLEKVKTHNIEGYSVSGTPADCVFLSEFYLLKGRKIRLVLSGLNEGSNASMQAIESSGTVSAVKFGLVRQIKGIAFSLATEMGINNRSFSNAGKIISKILLKIKHKGFPEGVDMLNINIPGDINNSTKVRICGIEGALFNDFVVKRKDLSKRDYYWLGGRLKKKFAKGTDCFELFTNHSVAISPIKLDYVNAILREQTLKKLDFEEMT